MTPKEKAEELLNKIENPLQGVTLFKELRKSLALIAVQEMIELLDQLPMNEDVIKQFAYLQEVKQEIKLL